MLQYLGVFVIFSISNSFCVQERKTSVLEKLEKISFTQKKKRNFAIFRVLHNIMTSSYYITLKFFLNSSFGYAWLSKNYFNQESNARRSSRPPRRW